MEALFVILFWAFILVILVCLAIRRIKIYQTEDFEKRDN